MEKKCGEVYYKNEQFFFVCDFCQNRFYKAKAYKKHILEKHVKNILQKDEDFLTEAELSITFSESDNEQIKNPTDSDNNIDSTTRPHLEEKSYELDSAVKKIQDKDVEVKEEEHDIDLLIKQEILVLPEINLELTSSLKSKTQKIKGKRKKRELDNEADEEMKINENLLQSEQKNQTRHQQKPQKIKNPDGKYECSMCSQTFTVYASVLKHYRNNHANSNECQYCGYTCPSQIRLKTHIKKSHEENEKEDAVLSRVPNKDGRYPCIECENTFINYYGLKSHYITYHTNKFSFHECDICHKKFRSSTSLKYHNYLHTGERPFKCHLCSADFANPHNLKYHLTIHSDDKKYSCDYCDKRFHDKRSKFSHERIVHTHTKEKPFQCDTCGSVFRLNSLLLNHQRLHNPPTYECEVCGKKFKTPEYLKTHLVTHKDERPFECDTCSKKFRRESHLRTHKKTHTKEFLCKFCGKAFAHKAGLFGHMKQH